jgi:hypothetical protein
MKKKNEDVQLMFTSRKAWHTVFVNRRGPQCACEGKRAVS